ncbi:MAG: Zn-dependent exopeptidase M28 [Clostridiales bacterium]|nr:Zn-dependent exopeptidase M28 [Clostridiales bacterium]
MRISEAPDESTIKYMSDGIRHVCDSIEPRTSGSQGETDAQKYFSDELGGFADEVKTEEFTVHPRAKSGSAVLIGLLMTFSALIFILNKWTSGKADIIYPAAATLFAFAALLIYVYEQLFRRQFIDFLFKKAVSRNVFAVRNSSGETSRRIVICAHADAAEENRWYAAENRAAEFASRVLAPAGSVISVLICFAYTFTDAKSVSGIWLAGAILMLCFLPCYAALMFSGSRKKVSDGANDDLSGCFTAIALMKLLAERELRFEHTQVCCLITGSNEAGLRGAAAFAKKHSAEMKKIETVFISAEALFDIDELTACTSDSAKITKSGERATELLVTAAENLGRDIDKRPMYCGASDSAAFSAAGFEATALSAAKKPPQKYYHTHFDSWNTTNPECISEGLNILLETVMIYDKIGLRSF